MVSKEEENSAINNNLMASDSLRFQFTTDGEGNYGYLGADDSFIPFKNNPILFLLYDSYYASRTLSRILVNNYSEYFTYVSGVFTCIKPCKVICDFTVTHPTILGDSTSGAIKLFKNNAQVASLAVTTSAVNSQNIELDFEIGDTFKAILSAGESSKGTACGICFMQLLS